MINARWYQEVSVDLNLSKCELDNHNTSNNNFRYSCFVTVKIQPLCQTCEGVHSTLWPASGGAWSGVGGGRAGGLVVGKIGYGEREWMIDWIICMNNMNHMNKIL